jgi:predicted DNA-binding protein YlxM (UPF0122 family)
LSQADGALLLDAYGACLTDHQRDVLRLVYEEDWSLSELAASLGVSRAAAADVVDRATRRLVDWEARLGLARRQREREALLRELSRHVQAVEPGAVRAALERALDALWAIEGLEADV